MINSQKVLPLMLLGFLLTNGCATIDGMKKELNSGDVNGSSEIRQTEEDNRPCVKNFSESGSFFSGKTFKSYQDFPGLSEADAFKLVAQSIASNGWNITNTDTNLGMISATQDVIRSRGGRVAPLSVFIKRQNNKIVRVECVFSLGVGLVGFGQKEGLCQILDLNVQTKAEVPPDPSVTQPVAQPAPAVKKETTGATASVWAEQSSQSMTVLQIQQRLSQLGYKPGPVDGIMGENTVKALKKFQQDNSLSITGQADSETVTRLRQKEAEGKAKQPSLQRPPTTEKPHKLAPVKAGSSIDL